MDTNHAQNCFNIASVLVLLIINQLNQKNCIDIGIHFLNIPVNYLKLYQTHKYKLLYISAYCLLKIYFTYFSSFRGDIKTL